MRALQTASIVIALSFSAAAVAGDFDGAVPLSCEAKTGHDCLPGQEACSRLKPETDIAPVFGVDFAKKEVRSPYRKALLPVAHTTTNKDSIVLQGADLQFAWSALIDRKTGELTVTVADNKGAYVAFGQCKAEAAKQ